VQESPPPSNPLIKMAAGGCDSIFRGCENSR
jgi:hypothetical protein